MTKQTDMDEITALALECGFTAAAPMEPSKLEFRQEVRDMCAANKCRMYGKSWACPPAAGTLEEISQKALGYSRGVLMQTTGKLEDSFDFEGMQKAEQSQKESFERFAKALREKYPDAMLMGTGGCRRCSECTYPDAPCRFPKELTHSMEACGLVVTDVCKSCGLAYYYGPNTMTYSACALF
jgi:predicted metal-binding protein